MWPTVAWAVVRFIAVLAVSYLVNYALTPRARSSKGAEAVSSEDWNFPQSDDGTPQCVFFGDCWTEDWQVLAYGNYQTSPIRKG